MVCPFYPASLLPRNANRCRALVCAHTCKHGYCQNGRYHACASSAAPSSQPLRYARAGTGCWTAVISAGAFDRNTSTVRSSRIAIRVPVCLPAMCAAALAAAPPRKKPVATLMPLPHPHTAADRSLTPAAGGSAAAAGTYVRRLPAIYLPLVSSSSASGGTCGTQPHRGQGRCLLIAAAPAPAPQPLPA